MKINKSNIHHAETIEEAIDMIEEYFQADMWYAKNEEWKKREDMIKYLDGHFDILRDEIKRIKKGVHTAQRSRTKMTKENKYEVVIPERRYFVTGFDEVKKLLKKYSGHGVSARLLKEGEDFSQLRKCEIKKIKKRNGA